MALQEFLANYAVKVDEDGARRLQRILDQNRESAAELTKVFSSAGTALAGLKAELSDTVGLKNVLSAISGSFPKTAISAESGEGLSAINAGMISKSSASVAVSADMSAADEALDSYKAKMEALRPKLAVNATGITSAVSSAIASVRSMMSSVSVSIPVKAVASLDTSSLKKQASGVTLTGATVTKYGIGGRVDSPTLAMIAEEGDPEYVIPVKNEERALPLIRSMLGELSEAAKRKLTSGMADAGDIRNSLSNMTDAARNQFALGFEGGQTVSRTVEAPVTINVTSGATPAEAVGQFIYDTARRSLLKTLEGVFA